MHVVGAEQVAHPAVLAVRVAESLGTLLLRPSGVLVRDQLDRAHLIETHDNPVLRAFSVEAKHPLGLLREVGVRAPLPRTGPLMREPGGDQRLAQRLLAQDDPHLCEVMLELGQRPARQRHALRVRAGAPDRHDPIALAGRGLLGTPAPVVRVQRTEPPLVERVNHLTHVRLIRRTTAAIYGAGIRAAGPTDRRPLALRLVLRTFRDPFDRAPPAARARARTPPADDDHLQARGHPPSFATGTKFP